MEILNIIGFFLFYFFIGVGSNMLAQACFPETKGKISLKVILLSCAFVAVYFMFQYAYELLLELSR